MIIGQYPVVIIYTSANRKIIATRIIQCLPEIISPSQSAFVQGRSIADNVLITQDLMFNYHCNNGQPRCALKIDIKKAYDSIG